MTTEKKPRAIATPTVPLNYFSQRQGTWLPILRLAAWVGIGYSSFVFGCSFLLFITAFGFWGFGLSFREFLQMVLFPAAAAAGMMAGSLMLLKSKSAGRVLAQWAYASMIICWIWNYSEISTFRTVVLNYRSISDFSNMIYRISVPVLLWLILRRRELQEMLPVPSDVVA